MASKKKRSKSPRAKKLASRKRLALGLDASTQSFSYVLVDVDAAEVVLEGSLDYLKDKRLNGCGLGPDYIVPPRVPGEADQLPQLFLAGLEAALDDLQSAGVPMSGIKVINTSGQQHGHVYLGAGARKQFAKLKQGYSSDDTLVAMLQGSYSYLTAPIWMSANTSQQADFMRAKVGGKQAMIEAAGSDAPLRFTGVVVRRVGEQFPAAYEATKTIQLISSFIPAVLTGNSQAPLDFANSCGTLLMDYRRKKWSTQLLSAAAAGLPGEATALRKKLPKLVAPDAIIGRVAPYFVDQFSLKDCAVVAGSGDNPQAKTLVSGDLLSLGTSFVFMVATDGATFDMGGTANAMYDGLGRPFMFGCRTNGTLVWNRVRAKYGLEKKDYRPAESALRKTPPGGELVFWQPNNETFPGSGAFDLVRVGSRNKKPTLGGDYGGVIDSSLAAVYVHSHSFSGPTDQPLHITGGGSKSRDVCRRVAAIWNRSVVRVKEGGPALGAAVAATAAFARANGESFDVDGFSAAVLSRAKAIEPKPDDVRAYHDAGGYLERFRSAEAKLIARFPSA